MCVFLVKSEKRVIRESEYTVILVLLVIFAYGKLYSPLVSDIPLKRCDILPFGKVFEYAMNDRSLILTIN